MRLIKLLVVIMCLFTMACASSVQSNLEGARFALDNGDYSVAITKAGAVFTADATNAEAARILASAYFARSGMDFFNIAEGLVDLQNNTDANFQQIADVLPATADLDDLRSAISTLESLTGIDATSFTDDTLADAAFDLGLMQVIESFALGVYGSDYYGTFAPGSITDAQATSGLEDLVNFDNRLIASGVDSAESFLEELRQTYCILEPISAGSGFTTGEYQALVGCELSTDPSTFTTTTYSADIANCSALDPDSQSAAVQSCYTSDTVL